MEEAKFSLLQFNAWLLALPFYPYAEDYFERKRRLPGALAEIDADIVCLQEVWRNRDKLELEEALRKFDYRYFFYTRHYVGVGDGIFLASKFPISRVEAARPFRAVTRFLEMFGTKRVIAATIEVPGIGPVELYLTHLGSVYFNQKNQKHDVNDRRKLMLQLLEVAEIIRNHRRAEFAILAGDLNFHYQSYQAPEGRSPIYADEYDQFMVALRAYGLQFENTFLAANGMDASHAAVATFSQANPYARKGFQNHPEETLDYVLHTPSPLISPVESRVVFREPLSDSVPALSDHYGIFSVFSRAERY